MRDKILFIFTDFINKTFPNEAIRKAILNSERKDYFINNMVDQVRIAERKLPKRQKLVNGIYQYVGMTDDEFKGLVTCATKLFCNMVINKKEQDILSNAERQRLIDNAEYENQLEQEFDEMEKEALDQRLVSRPGAVCN